MQKAVQSDFIGSKNDKLCYGHGFYAFFAGGYVSVIWRHAVFAAHNEFFDWQRSLYVPIWHVSLYDDTWQLAITEDFCTAN